MTSELAIKGDIEVLDLQPGDVLVVTLTARHAAKFDEWHKFLHPRMQETFPGHEIIYVADGVKLSVAREASETAA